MASTLPIRDVLELHFMQLRTLTVLGALAAATTGQERWTTAHVAPAGNLDVRLCYHEADRRVIAISARQDRNDLETWEWDGARWVQRQPMVSPPIRQGCQMAYDAARRVIVLFGGIDSSFGLLADTWEWDGATWTQRRPSTAPAGRYSMAMTFDVRRGRVVLYGGQDPNHGNFGDLWEWDGTTWTQRVLGGLDPGPRAGGTMTYDTQRGVAIMFGGVGRAPVFLDDVWEFDGTQWTNPGPSLRPPGLRGAAIAFDARARRAVLFGGDVGGTPNPDVWEWDGTQWTRTAAAVNPGSHLNAGLAYDAGNDRLVVHGGDYDSDTWLWDRNTATWARAAHVTPRSLSSSLATYVFPDRTLYVAGYQTFEWDHGVQTWRRRPSSAHPSPWLLGALTFDATRREGVLFGAIANRAAETWIWDERALAWQQRSPATTPPATQYATLAYDTVRNRTVLFGGLVGGIPSRQTWEWDGTTWTAMNPSPAPPTRSQAAMAFDSLAQRVVLFGGRGSIGLNLDDVWEWDGLTWSQRMMSPGGPTPRATMAMGGRQDGLLIVGGIDDTGTVLDELWALRGNTWAQLSSAGVPALTPAQATVHPNRDELTVFGGYTPTPGNGQLVFTTGIWVYGVPRAHAVWVGRGCPGSNGVPDLTSPGFPVLGNAAYALQARALVAQQPVAFLIGASATLFELPGACRALVSTPITTVLTSALTNGTATLPMPIPGVLRLAGLELYTQAAALDPRGPSVTVTQTLRLRLGR